MDLDNQLEVIVYYILIGVMTYFDHIDDFLIVSASVLLCIVIRSRGPIESHD